MQLAADEAGISLSSLTNDVQTMNRELTRAGEGGPVDDALKALGLSAKELLDLDIDERLAVIADRMLELGYSSGQATAVLQDFGVRIREMALLMVQGGSAIRAARSDIQDYGLALNAVDSERIEHANDQISRLSIISERFGQQLALVVVPALGDMAEAFTNSMREGGLLRNVIDGFANNLKRFSVYMGTFVTLVGVRLVGAMASAVIATGSLAAAFVTLKGAMIRTGIGAFVVLIGELTYRLGFASAEVGSLAAAQQTAQETADAAARSEEALDHALAGVAAGAKITAAEVLALARAHETNAKAAVAAAQAEMVARRVGFMDVTGYDQNSGESFDTFMEGVRERAAAGRPSAQRMLDNWESGLTNINDLQEMVIEAEKKIAALGGSSNIGDGGAEILPADPVEIAEQQATALQGLLDRIDPARGAVRGLAEDTATLDAALASETITLQEYSEAIAALPGLYDAVETAGGGAARSTNEVEEALAAAADAAEETKTAVDGLGGTFASTFADILTDTTSVIGGLAQLAAQLGKMALMKGLEGLFGNLLDGLSGGGAGLASLFGFNANGTDNWQGGLTMVGERGPELANLPTGTQIFNAQKSAQMLSAPAATAPEIKVVPKIINLFDMSLIGEYMAGPDGESIILNHMARNGVAGA